METDLDRKVDPVEMDHKPYVTGMEEEKNIEGTVDGIVVNASGHKDELQRHFSIWSLIGLALTIDNAWVALGGSLSIAICKYKLRFVMKFLPIDADQMSSICERGTLRSMAGREFES